MRFNIFIEKRKEKERLFYVEKNVIIAKIAKVLHVFLMSKNMVLCYFLLPKNAKHIAFTIL